MKRAAVLALAAVVAALLVVVREDGENSAQAAVRHAVGRTVGAGSMRFTMSINPPQLQAELAREYAVEGLIDYDHHRGRISYGHGREVLFDGDVTYMTWPLPWRPDAPWLRHEADSSDSDPLNLEERALRNPIGLLDFLTGASSDAREAGREDVRGTRTTHYEGTLDLQRVVDQAAPDKRAELQAWLNFIAEVEPTTVPFGLWVDSDGVAHRLRLDRGGASVTIDYYDFGVPVEITPPSASEIITFEELAEEFEQHRGDSQCDESEEGEDATPPSDSSADSQSGGVVSSWYSLGSSGTGGSGSSPASDDVVYCIQSVELD